MRNPFKPSVPPPLVHSMDPDIAVAEAEDARLERRAAEQRHADERARLLAVAAELARIDARKGQR